jgi:hypothetical protein
VRLFAQNETEMKIVKTNQLEKARSLKVGDVSIVEFEDYNKYRSFTVQLAHYNADLGRKRSLYVHAASKLRKLQYCLVVVSMEEKEMEEIDSNLKGQWKRKLPEEWRNA